MVVEPAPHVLRSAVTAAPPASEGRTRGDLLDAVARATAYTSSAVRAPTRSHPARGGAMAAQPTLTVVGGTDSVVPPSRASRSVSEARETVTSSSAGSANGMARSPMTAPSAMSPLPGSTPT